MRFHHSALLLLLATVLMAQPARAQSSSQHEDWVSQLPQLPAQAARTNSPQRDGDVVQMNTRSFGIPFRIDDQGHKPVEVQLLVCRGDLKWQILDRKPPHVKQFLYQGTEDGVFWFATRTIDSVGRSYPSGEILPQLKVRIDTQKPEVKLEIQADPSGRIHVSTSWTGIAPAAVQLFFATDVARKWHRVKSDDLLTAKKLSFMPNQNWQHLSLHATVVDLAGNQTSLKRLIQRPRVAAKPRRLAANDSQTNQEPATTSQRPATKDNVRAIAGPTEPDVKVAQNPIPQQPAQPTYRNKTLPVLPLRGVEPQVTNQGLIVPQQAAQNQIPATSPPLATGPQINSTGPFGATPPSLLQHGTPPAPVTLPPATTPQQLSNAPGPAVPAMPITKPQPAAESKPQPRKTAAEAMRPMTEQAIRDSNNFVSKEAAPKSEGLQENPYSVKRITEAALDPNFMDGQVPVRFSDSERFSLEYELEAVGSGGTESVELYGSLNGGKSWTLWGADPDQVSPFDIETKGEGVFGFRIVVVGRNGLASPRPLAGEAADILVVVDKTLPKVKITSARYGEGDRAGSLVIGYECTDKNLKKRPIAVSFSDSAEGPWTTIAAGLGNDRFYVWPADPNLPRQLYLRIDATDKADNVGTYVLEQPILTQGLAPRARIRGFRPLSGNVQPQTTGQQTAEAPKASFK